MFLNRQMRVGRPIVVMTSRYPVSHAGGVEAVARGLMEELANERELWELRHVAAFRQRTRINRIPIIGDFVASFKFLLSCRIHPAIVVVHGAEYALLPLLLRKYTRTKIVVVWHGIRSNETLPPPGNILVKWTQRLFFATSSKMQSKALAADTTVAISPLVASQIKSLFCYAQPVRVIPNGTRTLVPNAPRVRDLDEYRIMWSGTSRVNKGLDLALESCDVLRRAGHRVRLTIVGIDKGIAPQAFAEVDWISWLGLIRPDEVPQVLSRQDVFLCTSRSEGLPLAVLEALSAGLAIVASDVVSWVVGDAGITIAERDPFQYAEALARLKPVESRAKFSSLAVARIANFSLERSASLYRELLDDLI